MGNFYTNVTIRNSDRASIITLLKDNQRECYISPEIIGFTTVYDLECEEDGPRSLRRLAILISEKLDCDAITFANYDDDILVFKIYESGILVADYEAKPDHFISELELNLTTEQNAKQISQIFGVQKDCFQSIKNILNEDFVMALYLHENLLNALGMPNLSAGNGYNDLKRGFFPSNFSIDDFEHIKGDRRFFPI